MATLPKTFLTPQQYLERERAADSKSEYYNGEVFAISGGSRRHDDIVVELQYLIRRHLEGAPCRVHSANMRVLAESSGLYTYPDLTVVCGQRRFVDAHVDTLTNPTLLVEVLSPSTQKYDQVEKAILYREIPSLQELLLISQDRPAVELQRRQPDGTWQLLSAKGLESSIEIASIGYTLLLSDLYRRALEDSL